MTAITSTSHFVIGASKYATDDSFILFRYIDNIVYGNGFVYNQGENILGATTPLFTLIGAFLKYLFTSVPTPFVVAFVNIVFLSFASIYFFKVCRSYIGDNLSFVAVLVFGFNLAKIIPEGMETGLFLFLLFGFIYHTIVNSNYLSATFVSLLVLTRPDAGLIAILAFIYWWQKNGIEKALRFTVLSVLIALPWIIFSTLYFGSFIPQSLITKLYLEDMVNIPGDHAFKSQLASMSRTYIGKVFDPSSIPLQTIVNLIPFLTLVFLGLRKKIDSSNWIIFAIPFTYFVTYSISNPVMWVWYLSQMEPMWILLSFLGISVVYENVTNKKFKILFIILILIGPFYYWSSGVLNKNPGSEITNIEVATYIRSKISKGETVGINNIGILGYSLFDYKIIDFFGLTNDYAASYYPPEGKCIDKSRMYSIPPKLIVFTAPDWIVLGGEGELDPCFIKDKWFQGKYSKELFDGTSEAIIWRKKK